MLASPGLSTTRDDGSGASAMRWGLFRSCLLASAVFRLGLTLYGIHQDARSTLKYTDADYAVFSDAAWFVLHPGAETLAKGPVTRRLGLKVGTPYHRATYRYPPVLAVLLTPNHLLFSAWGKVLFSISDLVVGWLLYRILRRRSLTESKATAWVGGVWLLNPIVANISTRGSSEAILGALIVSSIAAAESGRWDASAVFLGLATHFKIYPVVYAASIWTALGKGQGLFELSPARLRYAAIAGATLHLLTSAMYSMCAVFSLFAGSIHSNFQADGAKSSSSTRTSITSGVGTTGTTSRHISTRCISPTRPPARPPQTCRNRSQQRCSVIP